MRKTNRDRAKANRNFKERKTRLRDVTIEMIVSMETVRQEITERLGEREAWRNREKVLRAGSGAATRERSSKTQRAKARLQATQHTVNGRAGEMRKDCERQSEAKTCRETVSGT